MSATPLSIYRSFFSNFYLLFSLISVSYLALTSSTAVNCQITRLIFPSLSHFLFLSRETICQAQDGCCVHRRGIIFLERYWIFSSAGQAQNGRTDCTLNIIYIHIYILSSAETEWDGDKYSPEMEIKSKGFQAALLSLTWNITVDFWLWQHSGSQKLSGRHLISYLSHHNQFKYVIFVWTTKEKINNQNKQPYK